MVITQCSSEQEMKKHSTPDNLCWSCLGAVRKGGRTPHTLCIVCTEHTNTWHRFWNTNRDNSDRFPGSSDVSQVYIHQNFALCGRGAKALTTSCTGTIHHQKCWFLSLLVVFPPKKEAAQEPSSFLQWDSPQQWVRSDTRGFISLSLKYLQGWKFCDISNNGRGTCQWHCQQPSYAAGQLCLSMSSFQSTSCWAAATLSFSFPLLPSHFWGYKTLQLQRHKNH